MSSFGLQTAITDRIIPKSVTFPIILAPRLAQLPINRDCIAWTVNWGRRHFFETDEAESKYSLMSTEVSGDFQLSPSNLNPPNWAVYSILVFAVGQTTLGVAMMWQSVAKNLVFLGLVMAGLGALGANLFPPPKPSRTYQIYQPVNVELQAATQQIDQAFQVQWATFNPPLKPNLQADPLLVARRMSLALMGTTPSLEEIRRFEKAEASARQRLAQGEPGEFHPDRWWLWSILENPEDRRFAEYFAERMARSLVGTEDGPFLLFRRRRFVTWLADQLHTDRPYNDVVRDMIAGEGLWTDKPGTNFITVTLPPEDGEKSPDPARMAGRISRAFLGVRLDCAQCHNHPFEDWTMNQFHSLAAFFGQTRVGFTGLYENYEREYEYDHATSGEKQSAQPGVPFHPELLRLPPKSNRRVALAQWVTHPENEYFARVTVNRVWALMFGRGLVEPVDDISTVLSSGGELPPARNVLAKDFVAHRYSINRLIRIIAATQVFQQESSAGALDEQDLLSLETWLATRASFTTDPDTSLWQRLRSAVRAAQKGERLGQQAWFTEDHVTDFEFEQLRGELSTETQKALQEFRSLTEQREVLFRWFQFELEDYSREMWASFPVTRLRPEQVAGAVLQSSSITTIDHEAHIIFRLAQNDQTKNFVERYGDGGEAELERRGGTIPQRLLLLNGELVREHTQPGLFTASNRISTLAPNNTTAIESTYLSVLSRRPTLAEARFFEARLTDDKYEHNPRLEDLFWTLMNTTEFSWNH